MAWAATAFAVTAIPLLVLYVFFQVIARKVPEDREHEIEVKFGPAKIRRRVGSKSDKAAS